jgi:hypothetical protein
MKEVGKHSSVKDLRSTAVYGVLIICSRLRFAEPGARVIIAYPCAKSFPQSGGKQVGAVRIDWVRPFLLAKNLKLLRIDKLEPTSRESLINFVVGQGLRKIKNTPKLSREADENYSMVKEAIRSNTMSLARLSALTKFYPSNSVRRTRMKIPYPHSTPGPI